MPMLSLPITHSAWAKLEKVAEAEGVAVRTLIIYRIRDVVAEGDALIATSPSESLEPAAA
jgi:hypothetical protein